MSKTRNQKKIIKKEATQKTKSLVVEKLKKTVKIEEFSALEKLSKISDNVSYLIDLTYEAMGHKELRVISNMVKKGLNIHKLSIKYSTINDETIKYVLDIIKNAPHLEELDLYGNYLTDESAKPIVRALMECFSLRTVDFGLNYFGVLGGNMFNYAIHYTRITEFGIIGNKQVPDELILSIDRRIKENIARITKEGRKDIIKSSSISAEQSYEGDFHDWGLGKLGDDNVLWEDFTYNV